MHGPHEHDHLFYGPPPWQMRVPAPFGPPAGPGGPRWGMGRRVRRGHIRTLVLSALQEGPAHGYEIIQRLEAKTEGMWRPSPGSVYPTLQLLEDKGSVRGEERDGKRVYELTDEGRAEAESRAERHGPVWAEGHEGSAGAAALRDAVGQLHMAAHQVAGAGQEDQVQRAVDILTDARKKLYQLLAE